MRRLASAAFALVLLVTIGLVLVVLVDESSADLDNQVFTSRPHRVRMIVPHKRTGWRATDQPSYPGLLLWIMKTQPPGQIVLTAEMFTRELYCSWPSRCRGLQPDAAKYACALQDRLATQRMRVDPIQSGPKENEAAGLPSVWFEYDDGKRYLRQAVAVTSERAISLVLSAPSRDARAAHTRAFDQALRTLEILPTETPAATARIAPHDGGVALAPTSLDGGVMFESAPVPRVSPIGPCPR
jgi:hypothetical protein